jgi:hypothetical protein
VLTVVISSLLSSTAWLRLPTTCMSTGDYPPVTTVPWTRSQPDTINLFRYCWTCFVGTCCCSRRYTQNENQLLNQSTWCILFAQLFQGDTCAFPDIKGLFEFWCGFTEVR